MALPYSFCTTKPFSRLQSSYSLVQQHNQPERPVVNVAMIRCESKDSSSGETEAESAAAAAAAAAKRSKLGIGSPIIVTEAPKMIKTAASVPCLRANSGLVKPGDVGRIVSRKPKDVWAVRLSIGTYLIDGKYFKPLDLAEYN